MAQEVAIWESSFSPQFGAGVSITVGAASVNIALPAVTNVANPGSRNTKLRLVNEGTQAISVRWGGGPQTAVLNQDYILLPNTSAVVSVYSADNIAAVASATGSTLRVQPGIGWGI